MTGTTLNESRARRARASLTCTALLLAVGAACASGPPVESSGIPGFEPTIKTIQVNANTNVFVLDSNDVVVAAPDASLLGGIFLLLDGAQLSYRRYFQTLPPRTAVAMTTQLSDSVALDSVVRAAGAPVAVWEHIDVPRDNRGDPLPIARFLVSSVRTKVVRAWVLATDTTVGPQPLPDWIVAGSTQLIANFPTSSARNSQLASQLSDLIPLDTLMRMSIPESAIPTGVATEGPATYDQGRGNSRGRRAPPPKRLPREAVAALQSASIIEFMWAREGRGIIKRLVDAARRGDPLTAVIGQAVSLPHDVAELEAAWRASLTPPKEEKK